MAACRWWMLVTGVRGQAARLIGLLTACHNLNQQHDWQPLCKPQVWHQVAARAGLS